MKTDTKINTLKSLLPDSPFVQEQITYAIKYAQDSENFESYLNLAIRIAEFTQKYSQPNFFKYKPILCALLQGVSEEHLQFFDTETDSILTILADFNNFQAQVKSSVKNAGVTLAQMVTEKSPLLLIVFCWLTEMVQSDELINTLKVAYLMLVLRLENVSLTEENYDSYNKLLIAINKANY